VVEEDCGRARRCSTMRVLRPSLVRLPSFGAVLPAPPGGRRPLLSSRAPSSSRRWVQHVDIALESACCMGLFQVFQRFHTYVANVSYTCCKTRSGCSICYNRCTHMLQPSVFNVSYVVPIYVATVFIFGCCTRFTHLLQVFYLNVAYVFIMVLRCFRKCFRCRLQMVHLSSYLCYKCCIWRLQK
jgi:hypothetical protein